jgi:hypothetical protein
MKSFCILIVLLLAGLDRVHAQSYRVQFPLPASTSVTSWGVNADVNNLTVDDPTIQSMSDYGARFLRVDLKWANIEKTAGVYDFSYYDALMGLLQAKGMRAILILDYGNPLYNSGNAPSDDASRTAFLSYAIAALNKYKGLGVLWEIWNEPDENKFWKPVANADDYSTLALLVGQAFRAAAPDEWIIGPGLSGFDWPFVERCFQRGLLQYWDAVSVHPYRSQAIPETALADFDRLKAMVELYRPAGRTIAIVDSEWGYSLGWVNMDPDIQAKYDLRTKFVDMMAGARTSITYSWRDQSSGTPDNVSLFGLHDVNSVERLSGTAYRTFAGALKGYKFITRLDIGSPSDYCILFASGTTAKLVAWTTGLPHPAVLPASPGSFSGSDLLGNPLAASTTTPGLPVTLTDRPFVLKHTSANPLLKTLTNWGRISSGVAGDVKGLQKLVGPGIVSSSWQYAPLGTTLTIRDDPPPDQVFSLGMTTSTLSNLPTLTLDSVDVQQALSSDNRKFDLTDGPRSFQVTVTTPDGASATQSCLLTHPTPIRLTILTPQNGQLTFRAENRSALAFQGGIKAVANGKSADIDLTFVKGELTKSFLVPAIGKTDMQLGLQMEALPATIYVPGAQNLLPTATFALVNRLPDPVSGSYTALLEGNPLVPGTAALSVVGAPGGGGITGMKSLRLDYSFAVGVKDIAEVPPVTFSNAVWPGRPNSLGMWIYSDGSKNVLRTRFLDSSGQMLDMQVATLDWIGWRFVTTPLNGLGAIWSGGAADGIVHGPIRLLVPVVLVSQGNVASSGSVYVAGLTLVNAGA